jgi:hypothetical protein
MVTICDMMKAPLQSMVSSVPIRKFGDERPRIRVEWVQEDPITVRNDALHNSVVERLHGTSILTHAINP